MTKVGLYAIGKSTTLESNKSLARNVSYLLSKSQNRVRSALYTAVGTSIQVLRILHAARDFPTIFN